VHTLIDTDREACLFFKAGKNRDGYFTGEDLIKQVDQVIDIFYAKTNGSTTGLFMLDNAPGHQRQAPGALLACYMPRNPHKPWTHKGGPQMCPTTFGPEKTHQDLYFPNDHLTMPGWFKGMKEILSE
jgi:hypothetical protein